MEKSFLNFKVSWFPSPSRSLQLADEMIPSFDSDFQNACSIPNSGGRFESLVTFSSTRAGC